MPLLVDSKSRVHRLRDRAEDTVTEAMSSTMRDFLAAVRDAVLAAVDKAPRTGTLALTAAAQPGELPTLGDMASWWAHSVDAGVVAAVAKAWHTSYRDQQGNPITGGSLDYASTFIGKVRNRIVSGTYMGVTAYDDAMDLIRADLASSTALGWSRQDLSARIAADLSWDGDDAYWHSVKDAATAKMATILDQHGPVGSPAREHAKSSDQAYNLWRQQANTATARLDASASVWQNRSNLIARTESTGVYNASALMAINDEGRAEKQWLATEDDRTRETHSAADGQEVPVPQPFQVGDSMLMMPGDPDGPPEEVCNCRCCVIQSGLD